MNVLKGFWHRLLQLIRGLQWLWTLDQTYRPRPSRPPLAEIDPREIAPLTAAAPPEEKAPTARWYRAGEACQVQGISLADGLIYQGLAPRSRSACSPFLLDPSLPLAAAIEGPVPLSTAAPQAYADLSPQQRRCFLEWLAQGRQAPHIPVGYILTFIAGLETRILHLLAQPPDLSNPVEELLTLLLELERLYHCYLGIEAVSTWCHQLLELCQVQLARSCQPETLVALLPQNELPLALRVALGLRVQQNQTLPLCLLWAWYGSSGATTSLRTPAKRCPQEFEALLMIHAPASFRLPPDRPVLPPLILTYRSPYSLGPSRSEPWTPPPALEVVRTLEVEILLKTWDPLQPWLERVTHALDPYSRFLGRNPDRRGSPAAVAWLPPEIMTAFGNETVRTLQTWLQQRLAEQPWALVPGRELIHPWAGAGVDKLKKKEADLLRQLLAGFGVGFEPDLASTGTVFQARHTVVLFRLDSQVSHSSAPSADWDVAIAAVEFLAALEMQRPQTETSKPLGENLPLFQTLKLRSEEKVRLEALWIARQHRALPWRRAIAKLKKLTLDEQQRLISLLDQLPTPPPQAARWEDLQHQIRLGLATAEPTAPAPDLADLSAKTDSTPDAPPGIDLPPASSPALALDARLLQARHQDSHGAAQLLAEIFTEDTESPGDGSSLGALPQINSALGLDVFHHQLLQSMGQQILWQRSELEALAAEQGLMLDGALENLNDVAFDHCDEPLTEGEDPIAVNDWVYQSLQAA
ncbi:TerB N-terminal domain-containing protein [Lyngbya confervoides]|uniref:TerB N-terminal domain-containing protein n=1 Tax=Lyngbya confervoides BDU141951 TaxID=1574623 RepID=A0ABD4T2L0_9CYAN|nr:TerB N-terminal domain-containing protein [Lyngbya confervoides]MCM1982631.1 TerB N-terminal domain-containing protein [Lyngbya confervoides BDU141951]